MAEEAEFKIQELFFSFTDKRGIILGGNEVFTRISEYTDEELFQKPHNTIRHQDMPKTIFKLFWSYLKADKDIVAYVKNKTKTGKYYWVLALAFPVENGYLSIRLKPTSPTLKIIEDLYARCIEREKTHKDLDENIIWLLSELKQLGFHSYEAFMESVLPQELLSRNHCAAQLKIEMVNHFDLSIYDDASELLKIIEGLLIHTERLNDGFYEVNMITKNLLIATAHLGTLARTIATIALNLQMLTKEVQVGSVQFTKQFQEFLSIPSKIIFSVSKIHFLQEIYKYKSDEDTHNCVFTMTSTHCGKILQGLMEQNLNQIIEMLERTEIINLDLQASLSDFVRIALGMNVVCISGKIEIAHLSSHRDTQELAEQLLDMKKQNDNIKEVLSAIMQSLEDSSEITEGLSKIMHGMRRLIM